ncbi:hemerythrin domain-containing protein [Vibrio sp. SCSIO 43137]|uniref:hemerythrin domain-containing protein n=1 Tax=Vibrio sp. SCSIO 43137 TaxID=3021011 RepID=UPI002307B237|nr:hemerythrin domain-containing protein [Vibrio sp. SCSIO 43137]WCE28726.1 hemerythrin domain-containing protein [Vibrio sp. SCSIO 43137]
MSTIQEFMTGHHKECDELLVEAENALAKGDWLLFGQSWNHFTDETLRHFAMEEETLFPAFEAKTGMTGGPTMVMRHEHSQVRVQFEQMALTIESQDTDKAMGIIESTMLLIQQHNMKEEQILYPMSDNHLPEREEIVAQMASQAKTDKA